MKSVANRLLVTSLAHRRRDDQSLLDAVELAEQLKRIVGNISNDCSRVFAVGCQSKPWRKTSCEKTAYAHQLMSDGG